MLGFPFLRVPFSGTRNSLHNPFYAFLSRMKYSQTFLVTFCKRVVMGSGVLWNGEPWWFPRSREPSNSPHNSLLSVFKPNVIWTDPSSSFSPNVGMGSRVPGFRVPGNPEIREPISTFCKAIRRSMDISLGLQTHKSEF